MRGGATAESAQNRRGRGQAEGTAHHGAPSCQRAAANLLARDFTDITYVDTAPGFAYTAFVTGLFSRKIVG